MTSFKVTVDVTVDLEQYISGPLGDAETKEEAEEMAEKYISKRVLIQQLESGINNVKEDDITYENFEAEEL